LEARAERFQTRRNAALQTKNESAVRRAAAQSASAAQLEDRKTRLERVRQNTPDATSLAEAREFFTKQKREAAAEVRSSVRGWDSARKRESSSLLEKATATRAVVLATRQQAAQNRSHVRQERQEVASKIRAALVEMEGGRRERLQIMQSTTDGDHRGLYERKFVNAEAAARVDSSEYGKLIQTTRMPESSTVSHSSPPALRLALPAPSAAAPKAHLPNCSSSSQAVPRAAAAAASVAAESVDRTAATSFDSIGSEPLAPTSMAAVRAVATSADAADVAVAAASSGVIADVAA